MKIAHVSFARVRNSSDPVEFLNRINYFTGILFAQATVHRIISIHCLDYHGEIDQRGVLFKFFKLDFITRLLPVSLVVWLRAERPDAVVVHSLHFPGYVLLLKFCLPKETRIFIQHHAERPLKFPKNFAQRLADRWVRGYFFASTGLADPWIQRSLIAHANKVHEVMEVSSHFEPVTRSSARNTLDIRGSRIYLWVGRLHPNKDPQTLVSAFKKFYCMDPTARLYVIHQTDEMLVALTQLLSDGRNDCIELVGKINHEDLVQWYSAADFIISTSYYEGSGLAVCEAMSCGCTPIVTDIPSFRMMTANGKIGILFNAGDENSLYEALLISAGLSVDQERQKIIERFRSTLSFRAIARKIDDVIQND